LKKPFKNLKPENLLAGTVSWFQERVDLGPAIAFARKKTVPTHRHSWIYVAGGAAMFLLGLQIASGILLMLYYQPTEAGAYESVRKIMHDVPYGWLVRSVHAWGAHLFVAVVCVHFLTVLFSRAYRKPRELTWFTGFLLLLMALASGFSGYLLPWNELSYYATLVGTQIPGTVPVVGDLVVHFLRGGSQVTGETITRFFSAHVLIVPIGMGLFLVIHLALIQMQGMSLPLGMAEKKVKDHRPFFSEFILIDACVWLVLFGLIVTLAVLIPAEIGLKADPLKPAPTGIKPEWYFLFMFKTLKLVPEAIGVGFFALAGLFLLLLPFLDRRASSETRSPAFVVLFVALLVYAVVFETIAWLDPGVEHPPEVFAADTYSLSSGMVSLALMWSVIAFSIFYLRRLLQENTRSRWLYENQRD